MRDYRAAVKKRYAEVRYLKKLEHRWHVCGDSSPDCNRKLGKWMAAARGWVGRQYDCLVQLWNHESGWNRLAHNPSSGAHGIPQSLPGSKMAAAGRDWFSNAITQIRWGLSYYIGPRYGSPCGAWGFWLGHRWY